MAACRQRAAVFYIAGKLRGKCRVVEQLVIAVLVFGTGFRRFLMLWRQADCGVGACLPKVGKMGNKNHQGIEIEPGD